MKMCVLRNFLLLVLAGVFLTACGGETPVAPVPAPPAPPLPAVQPPSPSPVAEPATAAAPAAPPAMETVEAQDVAPVMDAAALHQALIGTSWQVGDMRLTFLDESKVSAKGGMIAELSLEGITAQYTFDNGKITATAAGKSVTGAWDGQKLVFAGQEGVRQPT